MQSKIGKLVALRGGSRSAEKTTVGSATAYLIMKTLIYSRQNQLLVTSSYRHGKHALWNQRGDKILLAGSITHSANILIGGW